MVRVLLVDAFPSEEDHPAGSKSQPMNWSNRLSNWPRKEPLPLKSVSFSETTTAFPRSRESLAIRSWESWRRTAWLRKSQRIFTTSSRRLWTSESTWRETERTRMESSDSFWLKAESTDSPATTDSTSNSHPLGSTSPRKLMLSFPEQAFVFSYWRVSSILISSIAIFMLSFPLSLILYILAIFSGIYNY